MAEVVADLRASTSSKKSENLDDETRESKEKSAPPPPPPPPMGKIVVDSFGFYKQVTTEEMKKRLEPVAEPPEPEPEPFVDPSEEPPPTEEVADVKEPSPQPDEQKLPKEEVTPDQPQYFAEDVVRRYTLTNPSGMEVQVITYGAAITSIKVPNKNNVNEDVILGFDSIEGYTSDENQFFGATIGRYTGKIKDATVNIGEDEFFLTNNKEEDHIDGGYIGLDKVLWHGYVKKDKVVMSYSSPDNHEGYPGSLMVQISFHLSMNNSLIVNTTAVCTKPTPVNISQRIYFNLAGHGSGPDGVKEHCILLNADKFIEKGEDDYPTGNLIGVGGTYYDLRVPRPLSKVFTHVPNGGYDNTFCLTKGLVRDALTFAARLVHPDSGRFLEIQTDHPALHLYTSEKLPNPDMPPPFIDNDKKKTVTFRLPNDEYPDGVDPNIVRVKSKQVWPRQPSNPEEEHVFPAEMEGASAEPSEATTLPDNPPNEEDEVKEKTSFEAEITPIDGDIAASDEEEDTVPKWVPPKEIVGKSDMGYRYHGAICLIPQDYDGSLTNAHFPKTILYPGQTYNRTTVYRFGVVPQKKEPRKSQIDPEKKITESKQVLETIQEERRRASKASEGRGTIEKANTRKSSVQK